jgi:hypothetical protein
LFQNKTEFINVCVDACRATEFVTGKHHPEGLSTPHNGQRSVNCMSNDEMKAFLQTGDFKVFGFIPEIYIVKPNNPNLVSGSGVPPYGTTPTTGCDWFVVASDQSPGLHVFACDSAHIRRLEASGILNLPIELL